VVVYTDDAQVLLLRRRSPFEFWQSVTGSLNAGETPAEAAQRELLEETGLNEQGAPEGVTENTEYEWRYRLPAAVEIQIDQEEHSTYQWMPIDAAIDAVWSWTNREALEDLQKAAW
jgi:dATP pyrophosphohydrolase